MHMSEWMIVDAHDWVEWVMVDAHGWVSNC